MEYQVVLWPMFLASCIKIISLPLCHIWLCTGLLKSSGWISMKLGMLIITLLEVINFWTVKESPSGKIFNRKFYRGWRCTVAVTNKFTTETPKCNGQLPITSNTLPCHRSREYSIPHSPFPIRFFRQIFSKTHRLAAYVTDDRQADATL